METSIFLAKLIGPMFLVTGVAILINPEGTRRMGREFVGSDALIFLSGVITLPIGLAIVITHNVWVAGWPVIITIFGWLAVAAGIARMTLHGAMRSVGKAMIERKALFAFPAVIMLLLGAYLSYHGYVA